MPCTKFREQQKKFLGDLLQVGDPKADTGPTDIDDLAGLQTERSFRSNPGIIVRAATSGAAILKFLEFGAQFCPKTKSQALLQLPAQSPGSTGRYQFALTASCQGL